MFAVDGRCLDQPCEPEAASCTATCASPGIRSRSATAWSSPTSARRTGSRCCRASTCSSSSAPGESLEADDSQPRRRRPADHSVQLAAALRERRRQPARADPARRVLGPPVRAGDGADARGRVGARPSAACASTSWRDARRRPAPAPRHRGGDADAARRAEPAPGQDRSGRIDRLGAADRRHATFASTSPGGSSSRATSAACARR